MSEVEKKKPNLTLRGENKTLLSIWVSGSDLKIRVSRRSDKGSFEKIDTYVLPLEILINRVLLDSEAIDITRRYCKFAEVLESEEEQQ